MNRAARKIMQEKEEQMRKIKVRPRSICFVSRSTRAVAGLLEIELTRWTHRLRQIATSQYGAAHCRSSSSLSRSMLGKFRRALLDLLELTSTSCRLRY